MSWNTLQQILLTAVPVIALFIAGAGLSTWRRQLKGSHDFELSRRLLLAIYKTRDALRAARSPLLQPSEASEGREDWEASAYENRWTQIDEANRELKASILESEASWGEDFEKEHADLHKLIVRLMLATRHYLASKNNGPNRGLFSDKDEEALWGAEEDTYSKELEAVVKRFEDKVKPKLGRK